MKINARNHPSDITNSRTPNGSATSRIWNAPGALANARNIPSGDGRTPARFEPGNRRAFADGAGSLSSNATDGGSEPYVGRPLDSGRGSAVRGFEGVARWANDILSARHWPAFSAPFARDLILPSLGSLTRFLGQETPASLRPDLGARSLTFPCANSLAAIDDAIDSKGTRPFGQIEAGITRPIPRARLSVRGPLRTTPAGLDRAGCSARPGAFTPGDLGRLAALSVTVHLYICIYD